jgi:RPA family protein
MKDLNIFTASPIQKTTKMKEQEELYNEAQRQEQSGVAAKAQNATKHVLPQIGSIDDDKKTGSM